jgi:formylglycine-generating enzyme required for sulfatase activity
MPSTETISRQRTFGGMIGVVVLGFALVYHFFPRVFHVEPGEVAPRRSLPLPGQGGGFGFAQPAANAGQPSEVDAGPPLILASAEVIAAHKDHRTANLPEQKSPDTPEVEALLARAGKAMAAGDLVGDKGSAAALYAAARKLKPDSRRAAQGQEDVRERLVAQISQDIAVGDADEAATLLQGLRGLPHAGDDIARLQADLKILARVRPMLAEAASLLQQGKADQPAGGNALELYRKVQQLDPANVVAQQGLLQVQRAVLDRALSAVAENDFAGADRALAEAASILPDSQLLHDMRERVEGMRQQRGAGLLAQARSALDAGNQALAQQLAGQARDIDASLPGLADFEERLTNARLYEGYKPGQVFTERYVDLPGQAPAMVVIPAGSFKMGAPDREEGHAEAETPQHAVTLARGFALARSEVTVGQFREFVRLSGYKPDSVKLGGALVYDERSGALRDDAGATWEDDYAGHPAADRLPVVNVSWNDARAYADWLSQRTGKHYRLPSEAEFEYALRGGTDSRYWWGNGAPKALVENVTGGGDRSPNRRRWNHAFPRYRDGYWGPAPAMSFAANPFGLYDIDGNVSEWVQDCWHDSYIRAPVDGSAWVNPGCGMRVVRGGSWGSSPEQVRSAYRQGTDADQRSGRVGFRVLRQL